MNLKELIKRTIFEGISEEGTPDMKYYAFDWDDNIMFMPTKIMVLSENEEEIGLSTEEFAEYRHMIGTEPFPFKGTTIVGYAPNPFRYFGVEGDKRFIVDSMIAPVGPSWNDFVECINGGSIFAIITARGHTPSTLKEAVKNLITSNKNGINRSELVKNLEKFEEIASESDSDLQEQVLGGEISVSYDGSELVDSYLDRCMFEPVTYGKGSAANPEEEKIKAMRRFISYCKEIANLIIRKPGKFKNDVANNEIIPQIGFSDDDPRNIDSMNKFLEKEYGEEKPVRTYLTKGNIKKET